MTFFRRMTVHALDWLGYVFCEAAFRTDCLGPFAYAYRLGCWFYTRAGDMDGCK